MSKPTHCLSVLLLLLVAVLVACSGDGSQMRAQLEELERQNRADSVMTNDSLAEHLVKYFDRHGTPNERMRAHYILGRTYADMGEAPRAIDAYLDAASQADTTAADCDFHTLACIYAQMGAVYHRQLLLSNEIEARRHSSHYYYLACDTLSFLANIKLSASAYYLLNQRDSAEIILQKALCLYEEYGYVQDGLRSSPMLMSFYIDSQEHIQELKQLIDRFEAECNLFDERHELPPSRRQYYYYKGNYFNQIGQLDSAEFYYRKIYRPQMSFIEQVPIYEGLLSVFQKRHQADSIGKYARLYCAANDSSLAINDQEKTSQLAASYQYNRFQKQAFENEKKAERERHHLYILFIIASLLAAAGAYAFYRYRNKKHGEIESLKSEYAEATKQYNENLHAIHLLEDTHKQVINIIQQELLDAKNKGSKYEEQYQKALAAITEINSQYQAEILELKAENERLQLVIDRLKQYKDLSPYVETSKAFFDSDIVRQIRQNVEKSRFAMTEDDWNALIAIAGTCFPAIINDLNRLDGITPQKMRVCILSLLQLRTDEIANLLGVIPQYITKLKRGINNTLFGIDSARSLSTNLMQRYNVIG